MCLSNAVRPFCELTQTVERLEWESDIQEAELDRLVAREHKINRFFSRMKKIVGSNAESDIKIAIIKSMLDRGPLFLPYQNDLPNPAR